MSKGRAVMAMSGGVDSSTAAALLIEQGYEVIGVMMRLWSDKGPEANRCCSGEAIEGARRVCEVLGIPFHLVDYGREFKSLVVDYFIREYAHGRTPNPCLACNRRIKFGLLLRYALDMGADYLATGHYARVRRTDGEYQLLKGVDPDKDQSYFLYMLGQRELAHLLLPLGEYTKKEVRAMAKRLNLPVAERAESQDLCFVSDGDYRRFLKKHAPEAVRPGPIVDKSGRVIGGHKGLPFYTIGQRGGLGIAASQALYVLKIDVERNALVVGTADDLGRRKLTAREVNFVSGRKPEGPFEVTAKIRRQAAEVSATLTPISGGRVTLAFAEPLRDITPGQGVVFYQGEIVLGGGIIKMAM